jgi:type IV pilus assembly protein PilB
VKRGIGELLFDNGQISSEELELSRAERNKTGESIETILFRLGLSDENQVKNVLELEYGINYVPLKKVEPEFQAIHLVSPELVRAQESIPVSLSDDGMRLTLGMITPSDLTALDTFKELLPDRQIKPVVVSEDDFWDFFWRAYPPDDDSQTIETNASDEGLTDDAAILMLSIHIIANAVSKGCSNIHIEPTENQVLVHYRKEGVLFNARTLPLSLLPALVNRYQKMAALTPDENNLPQDGRLHVSLFGSDSSFRFTIVAGAWGQHLIIWLD